jgi:hypothetical protein
MPDVYRPVLTELRKRGIAFEEIGRSTGWR